MAKLTDTQLIVLSKAVQREDGAAQLPRGMPKPAACKMGAALVAKKLMRELLSKPDMPVWRHDDQDRPLSLVILKAGREAIGADEEDSQKGAPKMADPKVFAALSEAGANMVGSGRRKAPDKKKEVRSEPIAAGSRRSRVIGILSAASGATIDQLVAATGWLPHTTRAVLTGLRKDGFGIERQRADGARASTYRIVGRTLRAG